MTVIPHLAPVLIGVAWCITAWCSSGGRPLDHLVRGAGSTRSLPAAGR